jgi:phenylalanyl-tRNA synthetase beta subunit
MPSKMRFEGSQSLFQGSCVCVLRRVLCSRFENFQSLRRPDDDEAVAVGDPATAEFEVCRTSLLPAALKTLGANKGSPLPIKLFEVRGSCKEADVSHKELLRAAIIHSLFKGKLVVDAHCKGKLSNMGNWNLIRCDCFILRPLQVSDVVLLSPQHETGACNQRRLMAVYHDTEAHFEYIHGMLNRIMEVLGVPVAGEF